MLALTTEESEFRLSSSPCINPCGLPMLDRQPSTKAKRLPTEAALLRLMFQLGDEPFAAPKLRGMAVN
jgi:hypothetical protein